MIRHLFTDPDRFMVERTSDPTLVGPALVVTLAAIAQISSTVMATQKTAAVVGGSLAAVAVFIGAITGFLFVFAEWLLVAGLFFLISWALDGDGRFRDTFLLVGWGFVPLVFAFVAQAVATYLVLPAITVPQTAEGTAVMYEQLRTDPIFSFATFLQVPFLLWSGLIWLFAVKHARDLTTREAAITVGVPVALWIAFVLYGLV